MTDMPKSDPLAGIDDLLAERAACEDRIKQINLILQEVREKIDLRTTVNVRKPRLVAEKANAPVVEVPEPPEAACWTSAGCGPSSTSPARQSCCWPPALLGYWGRECTRSRRACRCRRTGMPGTRSGIWQSAIALLAIEISALPYPKRGKGWG